MKYSKGTKFKIVDACGHDRLYNGETVSLLVDSDEETDNIFSVIKINGRTTMAGSWRLQEIKESHQLELFD